MSLTVKGSKSTRVQTVFNLSSVKKASGISRSRLTPLSGLQGVKTAASSRASQNA